MVVVVRVVDVVVVVDGVVVLGCVEVGLGVLKWMSGRCRFWVALSLCMRGVSLEGDRLSSESSVNGGDVGVFVDDGRVLVCRSGVVVRSICCSSCCRCRFSICCSASLRCVSISCFCVAWCCAACCCSRWACSVVACVCAASCLVMASTCCCSVFSSLLGAVSSWVFVSVSFVSSIVFSVIAISLHCSVDSSAFFFSSCSFLVFMISRASSRVMCVLI